MDYWYRCWSAIRHFPEERERDVRLSWYRRLIFQNCLLSLRCYLLP
jgi:hypothetical protein